MGDSNTSKREKGGVKSPGDSPPARSARRPAERKTGSGQDKDAEYKPRLSLPSNMEPTYYIGGGNGNGVIESIFNDLGWRRITDKSDDSYRLKWCELKTSINYNTFREGEQLANHIPNCNLLTNKMGLLSSLQEYDRICERAKRKPVKLDFIPETYKLDEAKDRDAFLDTYKVEDIWICKPTGRNQGKGIFLVRSVDDVKQALGLTGEGSSEQKVDGKSDTIDKPKDGGGDNGGDSAKAETSVSKEIEKLKETELPKKKLNRIVQRYITNPLLLNGKKFDIRCYMHIASTVPFLVLYHQGYIRLSIHDYDNDDTNLIAHLTNQFIQKRDPTYKDVKDETTWSMERFNTYINEEVAPNKAIAPNWANTVLVDRIKQVMTYCFNSVKSKLQTKVGYFDLYGLDFMVDEDMKIWLIEVNVNPCLATNCAALKERVPGVVKEAIHLSIECFEKARKGRALQPLQSLKNFTVLHNGCTKRAAGSSGQSSAGGGRQPVRSPVRRSRSMSPVKESSGSNGDKQTRPVPRATATTVPPPAGTQRSGTTGTRGAQKSGGSAVDKSSSSASRPKPGAGPAKSGQTSPKDSNSDRKTKNSEKDTKDSSSSNKRDNSSKSEKPKRQPEGDSNSKSSPYATPVQLKLSHGKKKSPAAGEQDKPNRGS